MGGLYVVGCMCRLYVEVVCVGCMWEVVCGRLYV